MPELGPSRLPRRAPAASLACGAFLKNSACLIDGERADWSPLHGDLGQVDACRALEASVDVLLARHGAPIDAVAHDLHPDFHSTHYALALATRLGVPAIGVQHHHAHVAAVVAEHGLREPVIGLALDGIGIGSDGAAWGGEVLWVDGGAAAHRWQRIAHLQPLRLPGGDVAAREPWRLAAALLHDLGRGAEIEPRFAPIVGATVARTVKILLDRELNCPPTSSAGRWFDAAAGALGLRVRQSAEAEAAIVLERCAHEWLSRQPSFDAPCQSLDLRGTLGELLDTDPQDAAAVGRGAALFHCALANGLAHSAFVAARERCIDDVVLAGGCLMNRVLGERLGAALRRAALRVHAARAMSCGDARLALGQAWVAACTRAH